MNVLTQTWRQLVRRRLWPVALLLVAALVAVPVVLAKPATPTTTAPTAAAAAVSTPAQSYVKLADDAQPAKRRRVLGAPKDPFEPAPLPKVKHRKHAAKKAKKAVPAQATATPTAAPESAGPSGGSSSGPVAPVATGTPAPAPVKHAPKNTVNVRFGKVGEALAKSTLKPLDTLPASSPLVVFTGFREGGKVAAFMLTGDVTAEGDGTCTPGEKDCQTLLLHKGETEFLTFANTGHDGQYELDLNALHPSSKTKTASASAFKAKPAPTATATPAATATPTP